MYRDEHMTGREQWSDTQAPPPPPCSHTQVAFPIVREAPVGPSLVPFTIGTEERRGVAATSHYRLLST